MIPRIVARLMWLTPALLLNACSWPSDSLQLRVMPDGNYRYRQFLPGPTLLAPRGAPSDPLDLPCFFVNTTGDGVDSTYTSDLGPIKPSCLGLGSVSGMASKTTLEDSGISLSVKAGYSRLIRLFGMGQTTSPSCAHATLESLLVESQPPLYELGSLSADLFRDTEILIHDTYSTSEKTDLMTACAPADDSDPQLTRAFVFHGYSAEGSNRGADFTDELVQTTPNLPPTSSAGLINTLMADKSNAPFTRCFFKGGGALPDQANGRVDVLFRSSKSSLQGYRVRVTMTVAAGSVNTPDFPLNCGGGTLAGTITEPSGGFAAAAWKQASLKWGSRETVASTSPTEIHLDIDNPNDYLFTEEAVGDSSTRGKYLHVSIRARPTSGSVNCSALDLQSISATVTPIPRDRP